MIRCVLILLLSGLASLSAVQANPLLTPDQRGQRLMQAGKPDEAAAVFESPAHRAMAEIAAGRLGAALETWRALGDATSEYNLGTALTQNGEFEHAIEAFDRALAQPDAPEHTAHNRAIAEQLLALQQQQQEPQPSPSASDANENKGDPNRGDDGRPDGEASSEPADPPPDAADSALENEPPPAPQPTPSTSQREQQQASEQLLQRVPDDPGGLLRRRILREHKRRHQGAGDTATPW